MFSNLVNILLFIFVRSVHQAATQITCQASIHSVENIGKLICKYPQDLNQTKTSFCLIQYESSDKSDIVIGCTWRGERSLCSFDKGFRFLQTISDVVAIEIPAPEETLMYACDTVPPNRDVDVQKCTVTPKVGVFRNYTTTIEPHQPCLNSSNARIPENNHSCAADVGITLLPSVLLIVIIVVLCYQQRQMKSTSADRASGDRILLSIRLPCSQGKRRRLVLTLTTPSVTPEEEPM